LWKSFRSVEKAVDIISGPLEEIIGKALGLLKIVEQTLCMLEKLLKKSLVY
jgi:formate hydrogenlyase subunit 4